MSTTWREVQDSINTWAVTDWLNGQYTDDEDSLYTWAHETADGCEYVIYYHHQDDLWTEGTITPVHEAEADLDWLDGDIQQRIQACVYHAIYEALIEAGREAMEQHSTLNIERDTALVYVAGERIEVPVLTHHYTPKEA